MFTDPSKGALVGQSIGNYQVRSLLGSGAMGEVYLGEHPKIGRKVAIKVLVAALSASPDIARRFIAEAKAVNTINHPNIIQIFDFGALPDGRLYFTMEYLQGQELTAHLKTRAPLSLDEATELIRQLAAALDAAHALGIIHRDLKPDNIFLADTPSGPVIKVLDFGIAKLTQPGIGEMGATSSGIIMGTPLYMCPEQAAGQVKDISPRSDIYSLGVILYQMISGHLPLEAPTTAELLYKHIAEPPTPLKDVIAGVPEAVGVVLERSLSKAPADRQQSAGALHREFSRACQGILASPTLEAMAATQVATSDIAEGETMASTLGGAAAQLVTTSPPPAPPKRRGRAIFISLTLAGLLVGAGLAYLYAAGRLSGRTADSSQNRPPSSPVGTASLDPNPMTPATAPTVAPALPPPAVATSNQAPKLHRVTVSSQTNRVRVQVKIAGQIVYQKRRPTFSFEVKEGERISLTATRPGYEPQVETWIATGGKTVALSLSRKRAGRLGPKNPMTSMIREPPPLAVRPPPRVIMAPPPRVTMAPPAMQPVMDRPNVGVGTLRPMF